MNDGMPCSARYACNSSMCPIVFSVPNRYWSTWQRSLRTHLVIWGGNAGEHEVSHR